MQNFVKIEEKWQKQWKRAKIFEPKISKKKPFYIQVAYPYPSGAMHIGHARTYTVTDIVQRYKKMQGFNTLMPMGWHVSGTPVIAAVDLIKKGDPKLISTMTVNFKIPKKDLALLKTPEGFVDYFVNKAETGYKKGFNKLGLGIDWRRELTTVDDHYQKFIEWQYNVLYDRGLIVKGKYPVRYCPFDKNPVGDHDLKEGKGVSIQEFTLLKFKYDDKFLVAATLRPETVFGQTNLWVNPEIDYVLARVDGEKWIISEECFVKLQHQRDKVERIGTLAGRGLLGNKCLAPGVEREIPILPSFFCDPKIGTGVVTSVPSDAPADWMGLYDLQKDSKLAEKFGLDYEQLKAIEVIPIIDTEKYGDKAAVKVCKDMRIKNQYQTAKLEEAKKIVYKEGFHFGVMNKNCKKYSGMRVDKAKDLVKKELIDNNDAGIFYELDGRAVCYCNTEALVHILADQWFVQYSNTKLKRMATKELKKMNIVPDSFRQQYEKIFDWLEDKPCTRSRGLGTKFPWDPSKIIEPLGDSTIYMAYFTISHLIKKINAKKLTREVFDFIFFGKGNPKKIQAATKITPKALKEMKQEFDYWYPLAFNTSAVELIPNHMSISIFQHTAIFPEKKRQLGTLNLGMLVIEGEKMSSSKGNVVLIDELAKDIGSDMVRFFLMNFVEPWQEANWRKQDVEAGLKQLNFLIERFFELSKKLKGAPSIAKAKLSTADKWIIARLHYHLQSGTAAMEEYQLRKFLQEMTFQFMNDLRWYERRQQELTPGKKAVYKHIIDIWTRVMSPFMPHVTEELWHKALGNKKFVIESGWPKVEKKWIRPQANAAESLVMKLTDDARHLFQLIKVKPTKITLFVSDSWKYKLFEKLKKEVSKSRDIGKILKKVMDKKHGQEISKMVPGIVKDPVRLPDYLLSQNEELKLLKESKEFLEKEWKVSVDVLKADGQEGKARQAMPGKPAIFVE